MSASSGQRWRARVLRRWCSEDFVESGIVATGLILSNAVRVEVIGVSRLATTGGRWTKVLMGVSCALVIVLSRIDQAVLTARARAGRSEHRDVVRARIVLAAAGGAGNEAIAAEVGVHVDTVRKWRRRFAAAGDLGQHGAAVVVR